MSVSGCKKALTVEYCDAGDSGPEVGQVASITLSPTLATVGESLSYGQIGQGLSATALDCKGNTVTASRITYATTNMAIADINPSTGSVCGGTWNRNTGGGVQDYTTCTPPTTAPSPTTTPLSLTAPTASSATTASTTTLTLANPYGSVSGTLSLALGTGPVHSITVAGPTLAALATQITNDPTYSAEGIKATYSTTTSVLTISGPAAASSTLVTTGSLLIEISYVSAFVTASASGAVSNSIPIYIHPTVTSVTLGNASANCSTDPATTCCPSTTTTIYNPVPPVYTETACVSQGLTAQLVARVYQANSTTTNYSIAGGSVSSTYGTTTFTLSGVTAPPVGTIITLSGFASASSASLNGQTVMVEAAQTTTAPYTITVDSAFGQANGTSTGAGNAASSTNITCQVGHLSYSLPTAANIASIDQNGVATANQPGSTLVAASVASSSSASSAGFFSTCPPASITLSIAGSNATSAAVNLNNAQPLVATVTDTAGNPLTGISLEFESTTPQTAPGGGGTITPIFPGTAAITALCQPGTCNPSPFSQIGYLGNGNPIQSNPVTINTTGTSSTVIFMASTQSQYVLPMDFSTGLQSSPVKLPYVPNSMVITLDGSALYFGSPQGMMTVTTGTNSVTGPNLSLPGTVLAVSPDGTTLVVTDPLRQTISLYSTLSSSVSTIIGGVGTRAVWSPDSQTVYITTNTGSLLTHSNFTNWQTTPTSETYTDAVVMVPSIGAYFAGGTPGSTSGTTDGRSYCASNTASTGGPPPSDTNTFAPLADMDTAITDKLAATNIGQHILGAHAVPTGNSTFSDIQFTYPTNTIQPSGIVVPAACPNLQSAPPTTVTPGYFKSTPVTMPITGTPAIAAATITGVLPTSGQVVPPLNISSTQLAALTNEVTFVTYTGTGGQLPEYLLPASGAAGTLTYVPLAGTATAPISGVWSTDNTTFYTGTSGDNEVHEITQVCVTTPSPSCTWKDTGQLTPALPSATGTGTVPVNLIAQRPKKVTS